MTVSVVCRIVDGVGSEVSGNADGVTGFGDSAESGGADDVIGQTKSHTADGVDYLRGRSRLVELATQI